MTSSLSAVSYLGATILFILCLGGLSHPETSRRGNVYGMIGMTIAVLATVFGPRVTAGGYAWVVGAKFIGAGIGLFPARGGKVEHKPGLVALMRRLLVVSAALVGYVDL